MDDLEWPRVVNKVITQRWSQLKNTLVMKDFVDYLIQKRVVTLDYWMALKTKPITESERTEDFLFLVMKFDQQKYQLFLEALLFIQREDLVRELLRAQAGKAKKKEKKTGINRDAVVREARPKNAVGQTDADKQLLSLKPTAVGKAHQANSKDGHNGSQELFNRDTGKSAKSGEAQISKQTSANQTDKTDIQASVSSMSTTDKLHLGIGTAAKLDVEPSSELKAQKHDSTNTLTKVDKMDKVEPVQIKAEVVKEKTTVKSVDSGFSSSSNRDSDSLHTTLRPDTGKSRAELLDARERQLQSRESALDRKQSELEEQEEKLKTKEKELLTRENSIMTITPTTSDSMASTTKLLKSIHMNMVSSSSTTESDVLTDVREQLAAMKRVKEEIESEHTTHCNTPKDDYVKLQDFLVAQQEIDELRGEMTTDKDIRKNVEQKVENLQCKVEDLKHEINELQTNVDKLKIENEQTKQQLISQLKKLRGELKNNKTAHDDRISKLETKMQAKDTECTELKSNIEDVVKTATELEERVEVLENEKTRQEQELQQYQKEISFLKKELQDKETEINDLKRLLEETENEKDDLIEVLAGLKSDVSTLKAEKKQLEHDKRTLLGRCAKPQWNPNTRRTTFK